MRDCVAEGSNLAFRRELSRFIYCEAVIWEDPAHSQEYNTQQNILLKENKRRLRDTDWHEAEKLITYLWLAMSLVVYSSYTTAAC